jgi:hypothetical protein
MRRARRGLAAALAAGAIGAVATGCGGNDASAPVRAPAAVERAVRNVFDDYAAARREGDWSRACGHLDPESVRRLAEDAAKLTKDPPEDCAGQLGLIATALAGNDRRELEQIDRTARVDGVYETEPRRADQVIIAWAAEVDGRRVAVQQPARRVDGTWKLVGAGVG